MLFSSITNHLSKRGFATRKKWNYKSYIFFGIDNIIHIISDNDNKPRPYTLTLDDINSNDWVIQMEYWEGTKDDLLPFAKKKE